MLQNQENWRSISGYLNYQVSDHGRVRNTNSGEIKKHHLKADGYFSIDLYANGQRRTFRLHRLVAEAFILNPNNYPQVDHIDKNRLNNNHNNLRWATNKMNSKNRSKSSRNTSGITGVFLQSNSTTWRAQITVDSVQMSKTFKTQIEAINQRKAWELQYGFTNN